MKKARLLASRHKDYFTVDYEITFPERGSTYALHNNNMQRERTFQHTCTQAESGVISEQSCWSGKTLITDNVTQFNTRLHAQHLVHSHICLLSNQLHYHAHCEVNHSRNVTQQIEMAGIFWKREKEGNLSKRVTTVNVPKKSQVSETKGAKCRRKKEDILKPEGKFGDLLKMDRDKKIK